MVKKPTIGRMKDVACVTILAVFYILVVGQLINAAMHPYQPPPQDFRGRISTDPDAPENRR